MTQRQKYNLMVSVQLVRAILAFKAMQDVFDLVFPENSVVSGKSRKISRDKLSENLQDHLLDCEIDDDDFIV